MARACVKMKMKPEAKGGQGMSIAAAVKACYPKATKAALKGFEAAIPPGLSVGASVLGKVSKAVKKRRTIKSIKKSKPPKMKIRKPSY